MTASQLSRLMLLVAIGVGLLALGACGNDVADGPPAARPVRTIVVEPGEIGESVVITGQIEAQQVVALAFRIGGKVSERAVNVGDRVEAGQIVARLDPQTELNAVRAAEAGLIAAQGRLSEARNTYARQERLLSQGFTTRPRYDAAQQELQSAQAQVADTEARLDDARERLAFTELRADTDGSVTARGVEPGEVVQPGQMVLQVARQDGRDAVFDVPARILDAAPADPAVTIRLVDNPAVAARGRVREVGLQADPVTRTFKVRVGLDEPPAEMRLGATVTGTVALQSAAMVSIPAGALTQAGRVPAVWVVDPATSTVSLRIVEVLRFAPGSVILSQGLKPGETIVSAGIQALHPGQTIVALAKAPLSGQPSSSLQPIPAAPERAIRHVSARDMIQPIGERDEPGARPPGPNRERPSNRTSPPEIGHPDMDTRELGTRTWGGSEP